ncbi:MAG: hypothetical protein FWH18_04035 [Marinilabiliaceae bacterium]|nr:hypothetical protein [Marinilabiliaceae bacterium]
MKHTFLFAFALVISSFQLFGQKEFVRYSEFGGKAGWSPINNVSFVGLKKPLVFNNSVIGVRFLHAEEKYAGLIAEVNYNKSMTTYEGVFYSYDFIQTPLIAHFFIPVKKSAIGINVGSYLQFITDQNSQNILLERNLLFGLVGGLSFTVPVNNISLTLESRINYNLFSNSKKDYTKLGNWFEFSVAACYRKWWKH